MEGEYQVLSFSIELFFKKITLFNYDKKFSGKVGDVEISTISLGIGVVEANGWQPSRQKSYSVNQVLKRDSSIDLPPLRFSISKAVMEDLKKNWLVVTISQMGNGTYYAHSSKDIFSIIGKIKN